MERKKKGWFFLEKYKLKGLVSREGVTNSIDGMWKGKHSFVMEVVQQVVERMFFEGAPNKSVH